MKISGSEILIECLKKEGVKHIFGYPGGVVLNIFDALYDNKDLRLILTRHEQGAVHAADGYARSSGKVGYAITEQRAIFTFNAGDFNRLHKEYINSGRNHFGILLSKQVPLSETIKRLTNFLFTHSSEEIINNIFWV